MSPGAELRVARLRELYQALQSDSIQSLYKGLYHAAIRSDDPVLQAIIGENVPPEMTIPGLVIHHIENFRWPPNVDASFAKLLPFANGLNPEVTKHDTQSTNFSANRNLQKMLTHATWHVARCCGNSRLVGFDIEHWDEFDFEISINGTCWSGRVLCCDEWLDDDPLFMRLEELGKLVGGELLAITAVTDHTSYGLALSWIELIYSLFPQPIHEAFGIQSVMLPWNLAEASARAIEVLIDKPEWRFDELGPGISEPANGRLRAEALTADSELATAEVLREQNNHRTNTPKVTFNSRMIDKIQSLPESRDWSAREWVEFLDCSVSTVHAQPMWRELMKQRELNKLARQMNPHPSKARYSR